MEFPLSPKAKRNGHGYIDRCPAHEDKNPSLSINYGADGKLLLHCFAGCSFEEIINAAGIKCTSGKKITPSFKNDVPDNASEKKYQWVKKIWNETIPLKGTLGEKYYNSRELNIWSEEIRYHNSLYETETKVKLPGVVCAVRRNRKLVGIHRTFLNNDGSKLCKKMLGPCNGASVYVGGSGKNIVLCEGIENALSALRMLGWERATFLSALSAAGLKNFTLPRKPGTLLLMPDTDEVGKVSALELGERAAGLGWNASTLFPPRKGDWNDYLIEELEKQNA
tara:strand:+ start:762 stop:1601 length:840 start_codon:yes stop_codon:yes gene_type:complete